MRNQSFTFSLLHMKQITLNADIVLNNDFRKKKKTNIIN